MVEALAGLRVVDASDSVAGQFCGRLFADNGAEVALAEPPEGSPMRRTGPFAPDGRSTLFAHLNAGKASVARSRLTELASLADVLIVDENDASGLKGARATVRITPFGTDGPLKAWRGDEMVFQALAGPMYENGRIEGPPLFGVGHRASYAAGVIGYIEALAALFPVEGPPREVDVAIAEVAASMSFNRVTQFSYNGEIEGRDIRTIPRALARCADGWVSIFIYDNRWRHACRGLGLDDLADDARFATERARLKNWAAFTAELDRRLAGRSADEVVASGQKERAVVARAMSPHELLSEPQLVARGFWDRKAAPGEPIRLGPMFRMTATPQVDHGGAPAAVGAAAPSWPVAKAPRAAPAAKLPLADIKVLDLTTAWSGPMATRILAALGAEIAKVEGPGRIDDWRGPVGGGLPVRYPEGTPGERPFDRCYQFNTQNHDKSSLVLDIKRPAGLAIVRKLAAEADVLIANFSVGALDRMGLGARAMRASNDRLIVVEMPGYGAGGPLSDHVALGPSMEMMSGMARIIGYGDGKPVTTGPAYLDPTGGFNGAAAVLTALQARQRTGKGQYVEVAQREAAMHWIGEEILLAAATGEVRAPNGNRLDDRAPHDAFRARGEDAWVAIGAVDDAAYAALAKIVGIDDARFATLEGRRTHEDELSAIIAAWTASRDKHEIATRLQAAGVHAAPVQCARDLHASPFLRHRGLTQQVAHPAAGTHDYQGLPLHIGGWDLSIRRPAPTFGQHNSELLRAIGYDSAAIAELEAAGVIASRPR